MNVVFLELEAWERPYLEERLPAGHQYTFLEQPVCADNAGLLAACDVLSPFIFSRVSKEVLASAAQLKLISTRSTGFDHIDLAAAKARGIQIANVPEYGSNTVAEHTFALLLALSRRIIPAYIRTRGGRFTTIGLRGFDLRGKVLGVIGTGNIGLHVIRMALSFGMVVIAYDPFPRQTLADVLGFQYCTFDELLGKSDVVTLHCPATPQNKHLINAETLTKMRRGTVILNTSRGSLINTHDLLAALHSGHISGAGLDVLDGEGAIKEDVELRKDIAREELLAAVDAHRLLTREDVIVTPHNAFNSEESVRRILDTTAKNIRSFCETGKAANLVNA
ncbi:MAG TPA: NAD(P)-dependent oxidoreductase [Planctomycetota bacterium]|nr:NAD(P)-dependent oxidoreductase [Planctomycetota bacterium]